MDEGTDGRGAESRTAAPGRAAEIIQGYGRPGATLIAGYGRSQFLGEIGMLTGQRAYLTAVATSAGRVLAVPVAQLRAVMASEPGLSDLILRTFLLRHSILMRRGAGLTLIGYRLAEVEVYYAAPASHARQTVLKLRCATSTRPRR